MKIFRQLLFSLCIPALLFQSTPSLVEAAQKPAFYNAEGEEFFIPRDERGLINPWGYFDAKNIFSHSDGYINHYFDFTNLICDEAFLETLSEEELDKVVDFTVWLVRYSVPESRPDLKNDYEHEIQDLYGFFDEGNPDESFYFSSYSSLFPPVQFAALTQAPKFFLCKHKKGGFFNQVGRKAGHFGHWCKKHKKPLIIGAVVVAAVAAIILTGGTGGSAVGAVGGGLVGAVDDDDPRPKHINKPGEVTFQGDYQDPVPPPSQNQHPHSSPALQGSSLGEKQFQDHVSSNNPGANNANSGVLCKTIALDAEATKESILEQTTPEPVNSQDGSFSDKAIAIGKELGSKLAHGAVETAAEVSKSVGIVGGLAGQVIDKKCQESLQEHFYHSHEAIDSLFETDLGYLYSEQGKEEAKHIEKKFGVDVSGNSQSGIAMAEVLLPGLPLASGGRAVLPKGGGAVGAAVVGSAVIGSALPPAVPESVEKNIFVYKSTNRETGEVDYVGITNNFERRASEHLREKGIRIRLVDNLPPLSRADAKAVEQTLIELHKLKKDGGTLINKINSIAKANPKYADAIKRGGEILIQSGYNE